MASPAHTTRRSLFSIAAGAALLATPATAAPHADEWDVFISGISLMHPQLASQAQLARAAGYKVNECYSVLAVGGAPCLCFKREYGPGSEELVNFQRGRAS